MSGSPLTLSPGHQDSTVTKWRQDLHAVDKDLERKAVRRIDFTILPVITIFYLLSFLVSAPGIPQLDYGPKFLVQDRGNIGD